jgi:hypothetical protein
VYTISKEDKLSVQFNDGNTRTFETLSLDKKTSDEIFNRSGDIVKIQVHIKKDQLK